MKDSPENSSELEQKKFSFDSRSVEHDNNTVRDADVTMVATAVEVSDSGIDAPVEAATEVSVAESQRCLPGGVLAAERQRRGFAISDIANQLFLTEKQISALEADDYDHFPAPIFVTGYIRNYARLLDLPPDPLIELFNSQGTQPAPALDHVVSKKGSFDFRVMMGLVAGLVVIVLLWWGMSSGPDELVVDEISTIDDVMVTTTPVVTEPVVTEIVSSVKPVVKIEEILAVKKIVEPVETVVVVKEASIPVIEAGETGVEISLEPEFIADRAAAQSFPDSMALTFSAESWVEITDANERRVMFDLGKPGQTRVLSGTAPFKVLFGYSSAIEVTFNGEVFDQSRFVRGKVARFTLGNNSE
ncbi:MAG: DUF4115 domain-containing protein [Gammaproteobacteria bacterium]|nr:DUF4115 domain-containing protein [Gammaproteobacteria bacterium]